MKIVAVFNDGTLKYVREVEYMYGNSLKVTLTPYLDSAHKFGLNNKDLQMDLILEEISYSLKLNKDIKSVNLYDKQFIRSLKIQKIKNLI
jgi:hypothetical protein